MRLYTLDNVVFCRVFPTFLKGATLSWFIHLSPNSIDNFETLVAKFGAQFFTSKPHHMTSLELVNLRQEKGESLRLFMERFGKVSLQIRNLNLEVALRPGPFIDNLCKNPTLDLDELQQKATKFMQLKAI